MLQSVTFLTPSIEGTLNVITVEMDQPYGMGIVENITIIDRPANLHPQLGSVLVPSVITITYSDKAFVWTDEFINAVIISKTYEEAVSTHDD